MTKTINLLLSIIVINSFRNDLWNAAPTNKIVCGVKQRVIRLIMKYPEFHKELLTARLHCVYNHVELSRFAASAMGIVSHIDARVMVKKMDEFEY